VVEKNYGTDNQMFRDLVNQISATNVKLKSRSYSSVEGKASSIFGGGDKKSSTKRSSRSSNKRSADQPKATTEDTAPNIASPTKDNLKVSQRLTSDDANRTTADQSVFKQVRMARPQEDTEPTRPE
jgi:hypothetical protein